MTNPRRSLLCVSILAAAIMVFTAVSKSAMFNATLQIVRGSGEFQSLETSITITKPEALTLQWTTDQPGASGGTWQASKAGYGVVASGDTPAPAVGHFSRFTLPANAFLLSTPPASPVKFTITITPHNAAKQPLGSASAPVTISQEPESKGGGVVFGPGAVFPTVQLISYNEKIGVVPLTQLHYAGADVTVQVKNNGTATTDPMWLKVKDNSVLMRQPAPLSIPGMKAGASQQFTVHLEAVLPPPKSQMPEEEQYATWSQWYRDRCGTDLYTVLDWRGPQAQAPVNDHIQTSLAPNGPICDGNQCVKPCQIARNIHKELDGYAVGYSYFVGMYPKFENGGGYARTSADGSPLDFGPGTKITVASVSKLVTAIAAVRILDKANVSLDAAIGKYLPSDWQVSNYVKNLTFAQLLGQRSGIKDYGNVSNDYATLKTFYSQSVSNSSTTTCDPKDANGNLISAPLGQGFVPTNMGWCYSNFNFSIMRILLPKVAGFPEDNNSSTRPQTLANQYQKLIQQNSFDLVGQNGVACRPPGGSYAFAYKNTSGGKGYDWGDVSLICGAAGWYLSVEDIARVLLSITNKDGRIFVESPSKHQFDDWRTRGLGLDTVSNGELEKNGGWSANCDSNKKCDVVSTSAAIFGPASGPKIVGVLFINSNITGGTSNGSSAKGVLEKAYNNALYTK